MWGLSNLWLRDEHLPVQLPDSDSLHADLCASFYDRDSNDVISLWRKEKIKDEIGFSPDEGDALALTFAEPIEYFDEEFEEDYYQGEDGRSSVAGY